MTLLVQNSSLAEAQNIEVVRLILTAKAAGTKWVPTALQSSAAPLIWCMTGDGAIDITAAEANALVTGADGKISSDQALLSSMLQTYFTNIPAAADGAKAIAFAVAGIGAREILAARLTHTTASTAARNTLGSLITQGPATKVSVVNSAVVNTPTFGTNLINIANALVGCNVVFGTFTLVDVLDIPATDSVAILELFVKA